MSGMIERRTLLGAATASAVLPLPLTPPLRTEWRDAARGRTVPVLIRAPLHTDPAPLVLLSHGLGGSRNGLAYLGEALARSGYVAIHLQHPGSDTAIWQGAADPRGAMAAAALNVGAALARLQDIGFALDRVTGQDTGLETGIGLRIDPGRIAIAGHSYGAWTVSHMLGERLPLGGLGLGLPDRRLRAGIALSPIPPFGVAPEQAYRDMSAPILHVTGTQDRGMGVADWRARTVGYRNAAAPGFLAVFEGASHAAFAGEEIAGGYWNDPTYHARTAEVSRLFLDAVLRGSTGARAALLGGAGLVPGDAYESKGLA